MATDLRACWSMNALRWASTDCRSSGSAIQPLDGSRTGVSIFCMTAAYVVGLTGVLGVAAAALTGAACAAGTAGAGSATACACPHTHVHTLNPSHARTASLASAPTDLDAPVDQVLDGDIHVPRAAQVGLNRRARHLRERLRELVDAHGLCPPNGPRPHETDQRPAPSALVRARTRALPQRPRTMCGGKAPARPPASAARASPPGAPTSAGKNLPASPRAHTPDEATRSGRPAERAVARIRALIRARIRAWARASAGRRRWTHRRSSAGR